MKKTGANSSSIRTIVNTSAVSAHVYRPDIDGLRAVAVLLVITYHAFPDIVRGGYVGVDIFFVISGYLITGIILDPLQAGKFSFKDFYRRRIRRIFPALIVVLLGSCIIGWFLLSPPALAQLGKHVTSSAAFVPNFTFWRESGYFDKGAEAKPLLHLWSLGVEEQFYIVWPLTLYFVTRFRRSVTMVLFVATVASFIACVTLVQFDSPAAFYSPITRAWELFLGGMLTVTRLERINILGNRPVLASSVGAALIAGSALLLTKTSTFPSWWALMPTMGAALFIAAGPQAPINRVLSRRGIVAVGLISYPLYLWHWPLLSFSFIDIKGPPSAATRVEALVAAVVLAAVTYVFIEKPFRRGRHSWWHVHALVASMVFIGSIGLITYRQDGFKSRFPVTIQSVLNYASYEPGKDARANLCWLSNVPDFSGYALECYLNPSTARENGVLVWGDSHAGRLYSGVRKAMGADANIGQFTRDSCQPILNYSYPKCRESNERVLLEIRSVKPRTVILFADWSKSDWAPGSQLVLLMQRTLDELRSAGVANIILVGLAPKWKSELPTLLYEDWNQQSAPKLIPERLASGLGKEVYRVDAGLKAIAQTRQVKFVSLLDMLCNDKGCLTYPPDSPGKLFTWDYGHLTTEGATFVANQMIDSGAIP